MLTSNQELTTVEDAGWLTGETLVASGGFR